jgi:hypothetical protein
VAGSRIGRIDDTLTPHTSIFSLLGYYSYKFLNLVTPMTSDHQYHYLNIFGSAIVSPLIFVIESNLNIGRFVTADLQS